MQKLKLDCELGALREDRAELDGTDVWIWTMMGVHASFHLVWNPVVTRKDYAEIRNPTLLC